MGKLWISITRMISSRLHLAIIVFVLFNLAGCQAVVESKPAPTQALPATTAPLGTGQTSTSIPTQAEKTETVLIPNETVGTTAQPAESTPLSERLPDPSGVYWKPVLQGLIQPIFVTSAGDGSGRVFMVLQTGQIMLAREDVLQEQPFLDISDRTTQPNQGGSLGERGLLGLAFHPRFAENGYFYLNYTDRGGNTHISRFSVQTGNPDQADPASELQILYVAQPFPNHNGGALAFGPDGFLYAGLGDGGSAGDPLGNAQSLQTLLGKILRLDVDDGSPYAVPAANPFSAGGGLPEIWAYGLRNPWRISFDPANGDLYIADVGQNTYEEVNFQSAGSAGVENYGWNFREGMHPFTGTPTKPEQFIDPVAEYSHGEGCSVTGGVVYRGLNLLDWQGVYLYGDYCSGKIWGLRRSEDGNWLNELLFESGFGITSFGSDDAGEVYVIDYRQGTIYRLEGK